MRGQRDLARKLINHRQLQHQVVTVVEEGRGPAGERRERPREVELAPAHADPRVLRDQAERVGPDAEARARDVLLDQAAFSAEDMVGVVGPLVEADT